MQLLDTEIKQFQKLCKESVGIELSPEEAEQAGMCLVRLMKLITLPEGNKKDESESRTTTSEA